MPFDDQRFGISSSATPASAHDLSLQGSSRFHTSTVIGESKFQRDPLFDGSSYQAADTPVSTLMTSSLDERQGQPLSAAADSIPPSRTQYQSPELYLEPLNPHATLTVRDRIQLILEGCRPWREFLDLQSFALPHLPHLKTRLLANIEFFFYNYVVLSGVCFVLLGILNIVSFFFVLFCCALAHFLFVKYPDPIRINDSYQLHKEHKLGIVVTASLLAITVGHAFHLLFTTFILSVSLSVAHTVLHEQLQVDVV